MWERWGLGPLPSLGAVPPRGRDDGQSCWLTGSTGRVLGTLRGLATSIDLSQVTPQRKTRRGGKCVITELRPSALLPEGRRLGGDTCPYTLTGSRGLGRSCPLAGWALSGRSCPPCRQRRRHQGPDSAPPPGHIHY